MNKINKKNLSFQNVFTLSTTLSTNIQLHFAFSAAVFVHSSFVLLRLSASLIYFTWQHQTRVPWPHAYISLETRNDKKDGSANLGYVKKKSSQHLYLAVTWDMYSCICHLFRL